MENKDRVLLLKDLCGRLPYGVKCENFNHVYGKNIFKVTDIRDNGYICGIINKQHCLAVFDILELKPYLFPISSMTKEQKREYHQSTSKDIDMLQDVIVERINGINNTNKHAIAYNGIDWLNAYHFITEVLSRKAWQLMPQD